MAATPISRALLIFMILFSGNCLSAEITNTASKDVSVEFSISENYLLREAKESNIEEYLTKIEAFNLASFKDNLSLNGNVYSIRFNDRTFKINKEKSPKELAEKENIYLCLPQYGLFITFYSYSEGEVFLFTMHLGTKPNSFADQFFPHQKLEFFLSMLTSMIHHLTEMSRFSELLRAS